MQGGLHAPRLRRPGRTTTTSPRRRSRRSAGRCAGVRARRRGHPLDEGARVKVVLADYGAGNLRSVCSALDARGRGARVVTTDPAAVREAPLAVIAGVGHVESAAARAGAARRGVLRERVAAGRPAARDLRRHAAPVRGERGGRPRAGAARRAACAALRAPTCAAHGLERARVHRPVELLDGLDGADVYFAHSYAVEPDGRESCVAEVDHDGAARRRRRVRRRSPASSSTPSGAAPPARACSRTRCDGQEARDPLPRRRGRPGRQGRPLRVAARRRRSGRARDSATRSSAPTSSSSSTSRRRSTGAGPMLELVERAAEQLTIPFTVGGGISGLEDARALLRAGADKVAVNRAAFDDPAMLTGAGGGVRRAGGRVRDRRARRRGRHPRRPHAARARTRSSGRARRSSAAPARSSLTSIDADGTRAGYDLELTPRRGRGRRARDRLRRRRRGAPPRRGVRGGRRGGARSPRSCTSGPSGCRS